MHIDSVEVKNLLSHAYVIELKSLLKEKLIRYDRNRFEVYIILS